MNYELIIKDEKGKATKIQLSAENIVDITNALEVTSNLKEICKSRWAEFEHLYIEVDKCQECGHEKLRKLMPPHFGECLAGTLEIMSKVPVPNFNY